MAFTTLCVFIGFFTLTEVSRGNCNENIALNKPTYLSSQFSQENPSSNAVDGNHEANWYKGLCTATANADRSPWFLVDLLGFYFIHNVTIYNRGDRGFDVRLHDFVIEVFQANPKRCADTAGSLCYNHTGTFGLVGTIVCDTPLFGRFVRLWKPAILHNYDILHFCEFEVYGKEPECQPRTFFRTLNTRLNSDNMVTSSALNRVSCVQQCQVMSGACVGVNYNDESEVCELLTRPESTDTVSNEEGWVYYGQDLC